MNIVEIEKTITKTCDYIVGIFDSSGSMNGQWAWAAKNWNKYIVNNTELQNVQKLTITFSNDSYIVPNNVLSTNINDHHSSGTVISKGLILFEEELKKIPVDKSIGLIFLSDGADGSPGTLSTLLSQPKTVLDGRKLAFLCLGAGKGFPTKTAMQLRKTYHRGDDSVPAVFLIEHPSDNAYQQKFKDILPYLMFKQEVKIQPAVCVFPWKDNTETVYEGSWIITDHDKLTINGKEQSVNAYHLYVYGIQELFRSWVQELYIESLNGATDISDKAFKTLNKMDDIIQGIKQQQDVNILRFDKITDDMNFKQKAYLNLIRNNFYKIKWFYNDCKAIADGNAGKNENDLEVAKKMATGTVVGNYIKKTSKLRIINQSEYIELRETFRAECTLVNLVNYTEEEEEEVGDLNQKSVFLDKTLSDGLEYCMNAFDLFNSFPIVGIPVKISRPKDSEKNPWMCEIKNIGEKDLRTDTFKLNRNNGILTLNDINGKKDHFNAVLPIFIQSDKSLHPLLTSKLFNFAMSYNVTRNPDWLNPEAYISLIGNVVQFLILNDSEKNNFTPMIERILNCLKIVVDVKDDFHHDSLYFIKHPVSCTATRLYDISQYITLILYRKLVLKDNSVNPREAIDSLYVSFYFNYFRNHRDTIENFLCSVDLSPEDKSSLETVVKQKVTSLFNTYYTKGDFKRSLREIYLEVFQTKKRRIKWNVKKGNKRLKGVIGVKLFNKLEKMFGVGEHKMIETSVCAGFTSKFVFDGLELQTRWTEGLKEKHEKLIIDYIVKQEAKENGLKEKKILASRNYIELAKEMKEEFVYYFRKIHKHVLPLPDNKIREANQKNSSNLQVNADTGLIKKACMAKGCPFFLQEKKNFHHHLDIWGYRLPSMFHRVVLKNKAKDSETIYNELVNAHGFKPENYKSNKASTIEYISTLRTA